MPVNDVLQMIRDALKPKGTLDVGISPTQEIRRALDGLDKMKVPRKKAKVMRVIDGDTLDVEGIGHVRLMGVDTPETVHPTKPPEPGGKEASSFISNLPGNELEFLFSETESADAHGRKLVSAYLPGTDVSIAEEIKRHRYGKELNVQLPRNEVALPKVGQLSHALKTSLTASFVRGLLYPVSAFVPESYRRVNQQIETEGRILEAEMMGRGIGNPATRHAVASTPAVVGELAGTMVPGFPTYSAFRAAAGVGTATTFASYLGRSAAAATSSGAAFSLFAELDNGESRMARVARDAALNGMFEMVAFPLLRKAWVQELGQKAAKEVAAQVAATKGLTVPEATELLTKLRSGHLPDPATAELLARQLDEKGLGNTPTAMQAKRIAFEWVWDVLPENRPQVDRALYVADKNFGIAFDVMEEGQPVRKVHIRSTPGDAAGGDPSSSSFAKQLAPLRQEAFEKTQAGIRFKFDNFSVPSVGTWRRFVNFMYGTKESGAPRLMRDLPSKLGAAPKGSYSELGITPAPGTEVTIHEPGRPVQTGRVSGAEQGPPGAPPGIQPPSGMAADAPGSGGYAGGYTDEGKRPRRPRATEEHEFAEYFEEGERRSRMAYPTESIKSRPGGVFNYEQLKGAEIVEGKKVPDPGISAEAARAVEQATVAEREALKEALRTRQTVSKVEKNPYVTRTAENWTVPIEVVEQGKRTTRRIPLTQLKPSLALAVSSPQGAPLPVPRMVPHDDGTVRVGYIQGNDFNIEPMNAPSKTFHGDEFKDVDEEATVGLDAVRFFIRQDGQISLSVATHEMLSQPAIGARLLDTGPQDTIRALTRREPGQEALQSARRLQKVATLRIARDAEGKRMRSGPAQVYVERGDFYREDQLVGDPTKTVVSEMPVVKRGEHVQPLTNVQKRGVDVPIMWITPDGKVVDRRKTPNARMPKGSKVLHSVTSEIGVPVEGSEKLRLSARRSVNEIWDPERQQYVLRTGAQTGDFADSSLRYSRVRRAAETEEELKAAQTGNYDLRALGKEEREMEAAGLSKSAARGDLARHDIGAIPDEVRAVPKFPAGFTPRRTAAEFAGGDDIQYTLYRPHGIPNFLLRKGMTSLPEFISARNAAKTMIRRGIDPNTEVTVLITENRHRWVRGTNADTKWTLSELASADVPLVNIQVVVDEGRLRGMNVVPQASKMIVKDGERTFTFDSWAEAHAYITRQPIGKRHLPKLEADAEKALGLGYENSIDPLVDGETLRETDFMASSAQDVILGKRPLVQVKTNHVQNLNAAVTGQARMLKGGKEISAALDVLDLEKDGAALVYNKVYVQQMLARFKPQLDALGVPIANLQDTLRHLAARPGGLQFLKGRDPEDGLLYFALRSAKQGHLWTAGTKKMDAAGPYWEYGPQKRAALQQELQAKPPIGGGSGEQAPPTARHPGIQDPSGMAPDAGGAGGKDLADYVAPPHPPIPPDADPFPFEPEPDFVTVTDRRGPRLLDWIRIPQELFKDLEDATDIPFFSWFRKIESARADVEYATKDFFGELERIGISMRKSEREQVQLLFESKFQGGYDELVKKVSPQVKEAADAYENLWRKFWKENGFSDTFDEFWATHPKIRLEDTESVKARINVFFKRVPKPLSLMSNRFTNAAILDSKRDLDFHSVGRRFARAMANDKYLDEPWKEVDQAILTYMGMSTDSPWINRYFERFNRYRSEAIHAPDWAQVALSERFGQILRSLPGMKGKSLTALEEVDLVSMMTSSNYYANMAWQLGMTARNYLQTIQTVYPVLGPDATWAGLKFALRWRKDKALQEKMERLGVVARSAYVSGLRDLTRLAAETDVLAKHGRSIQKVTDFMNKGVEMYQSADDFNRVVAYAAQEHQMDKALKAYAKHGDWGKFLEHSGAEFRGNADGSTLKAFKTLMDAGDVDGAKNFIAQDFARSTQFVYTRGNAPYFMQSTLGRFFFQYGTWPSWYLEWMGNHMGMRRGSFRSNLRVMRRFAAVNATMYYGMQEAFGVDFARWTFLAPTSYQGGPMFQLGQQAMSAYGAAVTGEEDPVARIQAKRLERGTAQLTPFPIGAYRNYSKALEELSNESYGDFLKRALGLPDAKP